MRTISDQIFIDRCMINIGRKQYDKNIEQCEKRLDRDPSNYATLYILSLTRFYQGNLDGAFMSFVTLMANNRVRSKIIRWLLENIIGRILYDQRNYPLAADYCRKIDKYIKKRNERVLFLKLKITADYNSNRFLESLASVTELESLGYDDIGLQRMKKLTNEALTK